MPNNFLPTTPARVSLWLGNASTVINANLTTFGLTAADVTALSTAKTNLDSALANVQATLDAYHAAIKTRNAMLKAAGTTARATSKKVQANPAIPVGLKASAGFNVRKIPAKQLQPVTPSALVVTGDDNGVNTLKWAGMGNKAGTTYQVEAMVYGASGFSIIGNRDETEVSAHGADAGFAGHLSRVGSALHAYQCALQRGGRLSKRLPAPPDDGESRVGLFTGHAVILFKDSQ